MEWPGAAHAAAITVTAGEWALQGRGYILDWADPAGPRCAAALPPCRLPPAGALPCRQYAPSRLDSLAISARCYLRGMRE